MRKNQPFGGLVQIIVGSDLGFVATGLEPWNGNPNILRCIAPGPTGQFVDYGNDRVPGVENIVNNQHTIIVPDLFDDVVEAMNRDLASLINADV